jgi:hypothetical protein
MARDAENGERPIDLHGMVVKYMAIAVVTVAADYGAAKLMGHPKPLSILFVVAMIFVAINCLNDLFLRPWLAARRRLEEERRAEAELWRMN